MCWKGTRFKFRGQLKIKRIERQGLAYGRELEGLLVCTQPGFYGDIQITTLPEQFRWKKKDFTDAAEFGKPRDGLIFFVAQF